MAWHWQAWIRDGLIDQATFKAFNPDEPFYPKALETCRQHDMPMLWDRKPPGKDKQQGWLDSIDRALADGFPEFDLYELAIFQTLRTTATWTLRIPSSGSASRNLPAPAQVNNQRHPT